MDGRNSIPVADINELQMEELITTISIKNFPILKYQRKSNIFF